MKHLPLELCSTRKCGQFRSVVILIGGLLVSQAGCHAPDGHTKVRPSPSVATVKRTSPAQPSTSHQSDELDQTLVERCKAATVLIGNFEGGSLSYTGSGFVAGDGKIVVTCKHVVTGSDDKVDVCKLVFFSGTAKEVLLTIPAADIHCGAASRLQGKGYDETDVAIIRLPKKFTDALPLGQSGDLHETQLVWALGYPKGTAIRRDSEDMPSPTVHGSRIERIERKRGDVKILQIAGTPTHGDSGGPVITGDGNVEGILQSIEPGTGIVYAVPSAVIRKTIATESKKSAGGQAKTPLKSMIDQFQASIDVPVSRKRFRRHSATTFDTRSAIGSLALSDEWLDTFSARELTILRNEPYARRGYIFRRREIGSFFATLSWYVPRSSDAAGIEREFTSQERQNVQRIQQYQQSHGMKW